MEPNDIDTVKMVRRIRDAQYEHVKDKNHEERIAFYRERAQTLYAKLEKRVQEQQQRTVAA